ncbi:MAG TPA: adenylate kinase [archaeon]|nr:adenylate kinase [archaeon]
MNKNKILVVTGIPGVGKSTVLSELEKFTKQTSNKFSVINYGTTMLKIAEANGEKLHRDFLRRKSIKVQHQLQLNAAKELANLAKKTGSLVIDTHMIVRTENGYLSGLPHDVLEELKPDTLILIEADPNEIISRRAKDATRIRDKILAEEVTQEIALSRAFASACSILSGAPVKIIQNPHGKAADAAKEILDLI